MNKLIENPLHFKEDKQQKVRDFLSVKLDSDIETRTRKEVPEPKSEPARPAVDAMTLPTNISTNQAIKLDIPKFDSRFALQGMEFTGGFVARNVMPISGTQPSYPRRAQMQKIEGFVELEFTITKEGLVEDIVVLNEINGDYFTDAAIRSLKRWRFKPKLVNGKAVEQRAVQMFEFKLN